MSTTDASSEATTPEAGAVGPTGSGADGDDARRVGEGAGVAGRRPRPWTGLLAPAALLVGLGVLPLLNLDLPGVLPGPTYTPGTLQVLALCLLFASLALSYHVLFGISGLLSFGHALYLAMGAYGLGIVLERTGLTLVPAAVLVLVAVAVLAAVLGAISLRVTGIAFAMVTLAFAQAGLVLVERNPALTGGEEGLPLAVDGVPDGLVGVLNTRNLYWLALALLAAVFLLVTWFELSRAGHVARAARENETRVRVLGVRPFTVRWIAFVVGSALCGVVGMLYLLLNSGVTPRIAAPEFTLTILVVVVLGGLGSRWGAVVGGIVYTLLDQRLTALASSEAVRDLPAVLAVPLSEPLFLLGALFVLVVIFVPGGLVGIGERLRSRAGGRGRAAEDAR